MTELVGPEIEINPVERYFKTVWMICVHPTKFFKKMPLTGGIGGPLAFALVTHWIGSAIGFLWHISIGRAIQAYWDNFLRMSGSSRFDYAGHSAQLLELREKFVHWFWGAGSVIADPFFTLFSILITSLFVFMGARILVDPGRDGAPRVISYESSVRVIAYGMTPAILTVFPLVGTLVSSLYVLVITIIAVREVYSVDTGRAIAIALFPKLIFLGIIFSGILLLMFGLFKIFSATI